MMLLIQSGEEFTRGLYLMGWIGNIPIWTCDKGEARKYESDDDTAPDEKKLDALNSLFWVIPE